MTGMVDSKLCVLYRDATTSKWEREGGRNVTGMVISKLYDVGCSFMQAREREREGCHWDGRFITLFMI